MRALTEYMFRAKLNWDMQTCNVLDTYEIKLAKAQKDIDEAYAVRKTVYTNEKGWVDNDKDEHDNQSIFIIARHDGVGIACLRIIIRGSTIDPNRPEISRLCIEKSHRSSGLAICLYLAAQIVLDKSYGTNEAVFITKPALANSIGLALGDVNKLGTVKELKGLRAPYEVHCKPPVAPGLRRIYEIIQSSMY